MKCICVKDCFRRRRYKPGDVDYFDELPAHFISADDYKIANEKKKAAAVPLERKMETELKKLKAENKKLKAENTKLKAVPKSNPAPKAMG